MNETKSSWRQRFGFTAEFLLIFLAVFCGFLAENLRESISENQTERDYIHFLLADIKKDSLELKTRIRQCNSGQHFIDSLLVYLYESPPDKVLPARFDYLNLNALTRLQVILENRTAFLLKNSGGMRLIRKSDVSESILEYWKQQEQLLTSLDRYLIYRNHSREFAEQLYSTSEAFLSNRKLIKDSIVGYPVIQKDPRLWQQYQNIVVRCSITLTALIRDLQATADAGERTKLLVRKKYNLED